MTANKDTLRLFVAYNYISYIYLQQPENITALDRKILARIRTLVTEKLEQINTFDKRKSALCENYETATPHISICARCPVISAAPDGCGFMCGLTLKAVEEAELNATLTECLALPKINPLGGSPGITGGVDL